MESPRRDEAPALHPLPPITVPPAGTKTLNGGARLITVPAGDQPLARLQLLWEGGPLDFEHPGAVHVMAEALLEGTRSMSAEDIADRVDYEGARLNTRCSEHCVGLSLLGLSECIETLLPVIRSLVTEPLLGAEQIEIPARRMAAAETVEQAKVAVRTARTAKELVMGKGHPRTRVDSPDDFLSFSPEYIRGIFSKTIGRGSRGLQVILGGLFSPELEAAVVRLIESLPSSREESPKAIIPYHPETPCRIDLHAPEAVQSAVSLAKPAIGRDHPDYIPLRLAVSALGGYFGSRLMSEIRENRGLTYGISASLMGTLDGAAVNISAQCSADKVDEVITETLAQIRGLWENPLSDDELERLRLSSWSGLAAQADSPLSAIDYYASRILVGTPDNYFERQMQAIASMDARMIAKLAREYLSGDWAVVTCGPASKQQN